MKDLKIVLAGQSNTYFTAKTIMDCVVHSGVTLNGATCQDWVRRPGKHCNVEANKVMANMGVRHNWGIAPDGSDCVEMVEGEGRNDDIIQDLLEQEAIGPHSMNNKTLHLYAGPLANALATHFYHEALRLNKRPPQEGRVLYVCDICEGVAHSTIQPTLRVRSVVKPKNRPKTKGLVFGRSEKKCGRKV